MCEFILLVNNLLLLKVTFTSFMDKVEQRYRLQNTQDMPEHSKPVSYFNRRLFVR